MELKEFIKRSVLDVMEATLEAQTEWEARTGNKGFINPAWDGTEHLHEHVQEIDFDVAVTAGSTTAGKANAGIKVFSLDLGASGEIRDEGSTVSRLRFKMPIVPPVQVVHGGKPKSSVTFGRS